MSSPQEGKTSQSQGETTYQESDMSTLVKDAVREARESSRGRVPTPATTLHQSTPCTPTGLVIATSGQEPALPTPQSVDTHSPSLSEINHMDDLLAPTYDTNNGSSINGSSVGAGSANPSDDVIRKVEMEIANARKAATDAQVRLADALSKSWELKHRYSNVSDSNKHETLDDLDIPLRDILSLDSADGTTYDDALPAKPEEEEEVVDMSVQENTEGENQECAPEIEVGAMKTIETVVHSSDGECSGSSKTERTGSPTGSSSIASDHIPYTGTQQTFESGVELPLEDVEATLAAANQRDAEDFGLRIPSIDTADVSGTSQKDARLVDEYSEYTEETVSDGDGDENSEYTEETVHSEEGEEVECIPEQSIAADVQDEVVPVPVSSPKPWIVGSRDMHKSPKEAKPVWWTGGWWPDEHGKKESTPKCEATTTETIAQGASNDQSIQSVERKTGTESPWSWSTARDGGNLTKSEVEAEAAMDENIETPLVADKDAKRDETDSIDGVDGVLTEFTNGEDVEDKAISAVPENEKESVGARVEFRQLYPVPPQVPKPRPAHDIISENTTGIPKRVSRWTKPKAELSDLLAAVTGDSLHRRSNAVGALKILLSKEGRNKVLLARTEGFLEALVFVCGEEIQASPEMDTALIARCRAVTTIMKVAEPKENRVLVMTEPGLPECLVKVAREDTGEARAHACAALAMLAKTPMNKECMAQVDDLINVLALVVNGTIDPKMGPDQEESNHKSEDAAVGGSSSFASEDDPTDVSSTASSNEHQRSQGTNLYSSDSIRKQKDEKKGEFELQAKINACAVLMHLSKHCSISSLMASNLTFMDSMMTVSRDFDGPLHTKCAEIVCNITRFHANNANLARDDVLVETLLICGKSKTVEDRVWALRALQNISCDSSGKAILANGKVLTLLSISAMRKDDEQEAAVATLYNLSTEPSAVVPLTNTRNVVATLVHLAHNTCVPGTVQRMSCEALATIGLWLQTLAGSGTVPDGVSKSLLPTHKTVGWQRWD